MGWKRRRRGGLVSLRAHLGADGSADAHRRHDFSRVSASYSRARRRVSSERDVGGACPVLSILTLHSPFHQSANPPIRQSTMCRTCFDHFRERRRGRPARPHVVRRGALKKPGGGGGSGYIDGKVLRPPMLLPAKDFVEADGRRDSSGRRRWQQRRGHCLHHHDCRKHSSSRSSSRSSFHRRC